MKNELEREDKIYSILGYDKCGLQLAENLYLPDVKRGSKNLCYVGGIGSGKTASIIMPNILHTLGNYIVMDPYEEIYNKTKDYLVERGYKVYRITDGFNFLEQIENDDDFTDLMDIIAGEENSADPYWDNTAKILLKAVTYYILALKEGKEKNLREAIDMLSYEPSYMESLMNVMPEGHPSKRYFTMLKNVPEKTYSSVVSTLMSKLSFLQNPEIAEISSNNTISIKTFKEDKAILFINIKENPEYNKFVNIVLDQIINKLSTKEKNYKTYFLLDEMYVLKRLKNLVPRMRNSVSVNTAFLICVNSLMELEKLYGKDVEIILDACDTQMYTQSNSLRTKEYFQKLLKVDEEFLDSLDKEEVFIYEKGLKTIKAKKAYYYNNPEWNI